MLLEQIDGGTPLSQTYPFPVSFWSIGDDLQFVTLGGEVVVDYAIRLKSELAGTATWVAGYANCPHNPDCSNESKTLCFCRDNVVNDVTIAHRSSAGEWVGCRFC